MVLRGLTALNRDLVLSGHTLFRFGLLASAFVWVMAVPPLSAQQQHPTQGVIHPRGASPRVLVRKAPNANAEASFFRTDGEEVLVLNCSAGWCRVQVTDEPSDTGYVTTQEVTLRPYTPLRPWFTVLPASLYAEGDLGGFAEVTMSPGDTLWIGACKHGWCEAHLGAAQPRRLYVRREVIDTVFSPTSVRAARLARARSLAQRDTQQMQLTAQQQARFASIPPGKWKLIENSKSEMDSTLRVSMALAAEDTIAGANGVFQRPSLVIRCRQNRLEAYVATEVMAQGVEEIPVRWRLDTSPIHTEAWTESTSYRALFAPSPRLFIEALLRGQRLLFEFTRFQASEALVHFDIRGIQHHLSKVAAACRVLFPE
jgi:hypothetical protein